MDYQPTKWDQTMTQKSPWRDVDSRLYSTLYAESAGGKPDELSAVASVFLNRVQQEGYEKALKGSSAYNKRSPQYLKAMGGNMTNYESHVYNQITSIAKGLMDKPSDIPPYYFMENVKQYGDPDWSKGLKYDDIGRQRFYYKKGHK